MSNHPQTLTPQTTPNHLVVIRMRNAEKRVCELETQVQALKEKEKALKEEKQELEKYQALVNPAGKDEGESLVRKLTPRELSLIALLLQGKSGKEIAAAVNLSEQVVKNYLKTVYTKAGCGGRLQLSLLVVRSPSLLAAVNCRSYQRETR